MDQSVGLHTMPRWRAVDGLSSAVAACILSARENTTPFRHLEFDHVFPDDVYAAMLDAMPVTSHYRSMSGLSQRQTTLADGSPTRVKIDLFPEYLRSLPPEKRAVWNIVGRALCSEEVKNAFVRRLAPGLEQRFGSDYAKVGMYPMPVLTRDVPGYFITPHTDTTWKGITVQLYLPRDDTTTHIGTIFHERNPKGGLVNPRRQRFAPNTGYAFAVGKDTWHSADPVGPEVHTRDSILLTYFVDQGALRFVRNRVKRTGNFVLQELRMLVGR
jgi:hypothetical protein